MPESVSAIEAQAEYFANIPIIDRTYRASAPLNFFICIDSDLRYLSEEQGIDSDHFIFADIRIFMGKSLLLCREVRKVVERKMSEKVTGFQFLAFHQ